MEEVCQVGYINEHMKHAMLTVKEPSLSNPRAEFVQVVLTIENIKRLRNEINLFLAQHEEPDA